MSEEVMLIGTWLSYFVVAMFIVFLIAVSAYGLLREFDRWKGEKMAKQKRLGMLLGQQLEVEYSMIPETKKYAADVQVDRVFAYSGAVRVNVTPLMNIAAAPKVWEEIIEQCRKAEGLGTPIPY